MAALCGRFAPPHNEAPSLISQFELGLVFFLYYVSCQPPLISNDRSVTGRCPSTCEPSVKADLTETQAIVAAGQKFLLKPEEVHERTHLAFVLHGLIKVTTTDKTLIVFQDFHI